LRTWTDGGPVTYDDTRAAPLCTADARVAIVMRASARLIRGLPLRVKMAALLMAAASLPLSVLAVADLREARARAEAGAEAVLTARAEQLKRELDTFHRSHQRLLEHFARMPGVIEFCSQGMPAARAPATLGAFDVQPAFDPDIRGLGLLDLTGRVRVAGETALIGKDLSYHEYVRAALAGVPAISDIHLAEPEVGRAPTLAYVAPVRAPGGKLLALAALWVRAQTLWQLLEASEALGGPGSFAVLFDRYGIRIAHTGSARMLFRPAAPLTAATKQALDREQRFGAQTASALDDVSALPEQFSRALARPAKHGMFRGYAPGLQASAYGVGRRCDSTPWTVFYMIPERNIEGPIDDTIRTKLLFAALVCVLAMLLASVVAGLISKPVRALSNATRALARGELTTRVPDVGDDEIGQLAASFNTMAEHLEQAKHALEDRVKERTAELERLTHDLTAQIAERTRAEAALRASEQDVATTLASIGDAVIATDAEGRVTRMNGVAEQLTGWRVEEAQLLPLSEVFRVVHEDTREPMSSPVEMVLRHGAVAGLAHQARLIARDGSECPIADSSAPIRDAHGVMRGVVLVFRDVRAERAAETRLQESEAKYRDLYENSPDMYALASISTASLEDCNQTLADTLGYAKRELIGKPVAMLYHRDCEAARERAVRTFDDTGAVAGAELVLMRSDGSKLDVSLNATAVRDHAGNKVQSRLVWRDITLRKQIERDRIMLSDLLEARTNLEDADNVLRDATERLSKHLGLARCNVFEIDPIEDTSLMQGEYHASGLPPVLNRYPNTALNPITAAELERGVVLVCSDTRTDPMTAALYESMYGRHHTAAFVAVPLMRAARRVATLWAIKAEPYPFSAREVQLIQLVAERTWSWVEQQRMLQSLRVSEERFRLLAESVTGFTTFMLDADGTVATWNAGAERMKGYTPAEIIGRHFSVFYPPELRERAQPILERARAEGRYEEEGWRMRKDGSRFLAHVVIHALRNAQGQLRGFAKITQDLTERERFAAERARLVEELQALTRELEQRVAARTRELQSAHETLARSEARFRALFDDSPISLWEVDCAAALTYLSEHRAAGMITDEVLGQLHILAANQATLRLFEVSSVDELISELPRLASRDVLSVFQEQLRAFLDGQTTFETETAVRTLRGGSKDVSLRLSVVPGHEQTWSRVVVSLFDLTAYKQAEQQIRNSLREKEVLLKEIHHRVKNNLQVISSLLNLQARYLPEAKSRSLFGEAQRRVQSIALVHERLYQSKDLSHVGFDEYVRALIENLFYTQDAASRGIEASLRLGAVRLSIDAAIPCGLIVNELVTNALKYAFPEGRHGTIEIRMSTDADGCVELQVSDDGVGLPPELNPRETASLGLELVFAFAQQIDAQVEVLREHGTGFRFHFQNQAA
jgi:PAS domain S-box-containing protein